MMIPDDKDKAKKGAAGDAATQSQPTQQEGQSDGGSGSAPSWLASVTSSSGQPISAAQNVGGVNKTGTYLDDAVTTSGLHSYRPYRNPNDARQDDTFTAEELGISVPAQKNAPASAYPPHIGGETAGERRSGTSLAPPIGDGDLCMSVTTVPEP